MSVIDFAAKKLEREPHSEGWRICLGCRHEWRGVAPLGVNSSLECPECGLAKGVTKNLYGEEDGDAVFLCNCGCDVLFASVDRQGVRRIQCVACGVNHADSLL